MPESVFLLFSCDILQRLCYPWTPITLLLSDYTGCVQRISICCLIWFLVLVAMVKSSDICCVSNCGKTREANIILHKFPSPVKEPDRFRTWIYSISDDLLALANEFIYKYRRVCHIHFEQKYVAGESGRLFANAVPTLQLKGGHALQTPLMDITSEQNVVAVDASQTTTSQDSDTPDLLPKKEPPETEEDPLLLKIQPCRFCRQYNTECLDISDKPYALDMKTTLAFNNMEIQIDFNDGLSDKVCRSCDSQLRSIMSFVALVKKAQDDFKEISEDADKIILKIEKDAADEDMRNIEMKTKPQSNYEPIEDFVIDEETTLVLKPVKRKYAVGVKKKKPKISKSEHQFTWDVAEDIVDVDNIDKIEHSVGGTGVRSSEFGISGVRSETFVLQSVSDKRLRTVGGETSRSAYISGGEYPSVRLRFD